MWDSATGFLIWDHQVPSDSFIAPHAASFNGKIIVLSGGDTITALDSNDGTVSWTAKNDK